MSWRSQAGSGAAIGTVASHHTASPVFTLTPAPRHGGSVVLEVQKTADVRSANPRLVSALKCSQGSVGLQILLESLALLSPGLIDSVDHKELQAI